MFSQHLSAITADGDEAKCVLFCDNDRWTGANREKAERKRGGKKEQSDGVERKCVHSRLILGGRTLWFPARTRVQTMLMQQKHSCLVWHC